MREIKFRAWDADYGKMSEPFYLGETPTVIMFTGNGGHSLEITEDTIVMQYTGIKDKNGTEIYEGDIVSFEYNPVNTVVWCNKFGCWGCEGYSKKTGEVFEWFQLRESVAKNIIVHGNIYES